MSTAAVKADFASQYKHLCDDELLAVAAQRSNLTFDANLALEAEMADRRLTQADLDAYVSSLAQPEQETSEFDEYVERFSHCSENELRRVAAEPLTLTAEMRAALVHEFQERRLALPAALAPPPGTAGA